MFADGGGVYEGAFVTGPPTGAPLRQGKGTYSDAFSSYTGEWHGDKRHGTGKYASASGASYVGEFVADAFHGAGTYTWPDGARYIGSWAANRMHGEGEYVSADGVRWVGTFVNGLFHNGKTLVVVRTPGTSTTAAR